MQEDPGVAIARASVSKSFGRIAAVRDVTLALADGDFFSQQSAGRRVVRA